MKKNTVLIYFYSDYIESFLNLYTSIKDLGMLDAKNIYSVLIHGNLDNFSDKSLINKFNKTVYLNCSSDLYGYFKGIKSINIEEFDYFILMNSSCIGPILPNYYPKKKWDLIFTRDLKKFGLISPVVELPPLDDKYVKNLKFKKQLNNLKVLMTIPFAHSYFLAFNKKAIITLISNNAFPMKDVNKNDAVGFYERLITAIILNNNFKIKSNLYRFKEFSFDIQSVKNFLKKILKSNKFDNIFIDPEIPNIGNFGSDLHPYEVVFFKNIRFPHTHRGVKQAGISENNINFLGNIIGLYRNSISLNISPQNNKSYKDKFFQKERFMNKLFKIKTKIFKKFSKLFNRLLKKKIF